MAWRGASESGDVFLTPFDEKVSPQGRQTAQSTRKNLYKQDHEDPGSLLQRACKNRNPGASEKERSFVAKNAPQDDHPRQMVTWGIDQNACEVAVIVPSWIRGAIRCGG